MAKITEKTFRKNKFIIMRKNNNNCQEKVMNRKINIFLNE